MRALASMINVCLLFFFLSSLFLQSVVIFLNHTKMLDDGLSRSSNLYIGYKLAAVAAASALLFVVVAAFFLPVLPHILYIVFFFYV